MTTRTDTTTRPQTTADVAAHWQLRAAVYAAAGDTKRAKDCAQIAREFQKPTTKAGR